MRLEHHAWACPPPLDRHLLWVWRLTGELPPASRVPALPDTASAHLILRFGAPFHLQTSEGLRELPARAVVGGFDDGQTIVTGGRVDNVGLYLPAGCTCLLGVAPAGVRGRIAPLAEISEELDCALAEWVETTARGPTGLEALLEIVAARVRPACDPLVHAAAAAFAAGTAVAEVAERLGLSRRQLTRRFEAKVGKSPREFVRLSRFALAWQTAAAQPRATWATVAAEAGYADQPHLDRDFRLLAGAAPTRVFSEGRVVNAEVVSHPFKSGPLPEE